MKPLGTSIIFWYCLLLISITLQSQNKPIKQSTPDTNATVLTNMSFGIRTGIFRNVGSNHNSVFVAGAYMLNVNYHVTNKLQLGFEHLGSSIYLGQKNKTDINGNPMGTEPVFAHTFTFLLKSNYSIYLLSSEELSAFVGVGIGLARFINPDLPLLFPGEIWKGERINSPVMNTEFGFRYKNVIFSTFFNYGTVRRRFDRGRYNYLGSSLGYVLNF